MISICIPTFNRCHFLERTLRQIQKQIDTNNLATEFEICVSDNASLDGTREVVDKIQPEIPSLRYQIQTSNIGFQKNAFSTADFARGEWIYFMGDDDSLLDGALSSIQDSLDERSNLIIFNSDTGDGLRKSFREGESTYQLDNSRDVLELLGTHHISFMGNTLFRREPFLPNRRERDTLSIYPLTIVAWRLIEQHGAKFVDTPLMTGDHGNRDWMVWLPIFSSIDMARVLTEGPLKNVSNPWPYYWHVMKSLPRAIYRIRTGLLQNKIGNPFREVSMKNLLQCYSLSTKAKLISQSLNILSWCLPNSLLNRFLSRIGTSDELPEKFPLGSQTSLS